MSNFKGTRGKWIRFKLLKTDYISETNEIHFGEDGECVAEQVQNDYDALLISKAPEMLEMLEKVSIFIKENKGKNYMVELLRREVPEIEQLIKEATEL
jgi:hypothetical protein